MWEIDNFDQIISFAVFLLSGVVLKLFYDVMRAKRKVRKSGKIRVFFFDILFWLVSAAVTFLLLLVRTNGEVRGYVLFAQVTGFVLCHFTISKIWMKILVFILKIYYALTEKISAFLNTLAYCLMRFSSFVFKNIVKCLKKGVKCVKKLLKNIKRMLYTKRNSDSLRGEEVKSEG